MEIAERRSSEAAKSEARNHDTMTTAIEGRASPVSHLNPNDSARDASLDISSPRGVWDEREIRPETA